MLEAFEGYLHRTRCSGRFRGFEVTNVVSLIEGISSQVVAGSANGGGAVEVIIFWI